MKTALISLQSLLADPAPNDPQDAQVAKHYISDRPGFDKTARLWTIKHATGSIDDAAGVDKEMLRRLLDMGFQRDSAINALLQSGMDENQALEMLLK